MPFSSAHVVHTDQSFSGPAFEAVSQLWMMRVRYVRRRGHVVAADPDPLDHRPAFGHGRLLVLRGEQIGTEGEAHAIELLLALALGVEQIALAAPMPVLIADANALVLRARWRGGSELSTRRIERSQSP